LLLPLRIQLLDTAPPVFAWVECPVTDMLWEESWLDLLTDPSDYFIDVLFEGAGRDPSWAKCVVTPHTWTEIPID